MRIRRFNESYEPHEISDYFLDWVENDGFTYEPSGSLIRLFYSGEVKDMDSVIAKYKTLVKRLEAKWGIKTKSIKVEESPNAQAIEVVIHLNEVDDFKIEFWVDDTKVTGDISYCEISGYRTNPVTNRSETVYSNLTNIYKIMVSFSNLSHSRYNWLKFTSELGVPLGKNCHRTVGADHYSFRIDTHNVQKILTAIKSRNIKFSNQPGSRTPVDEVMPFIERLKPEDLSNIK